MVCRPEIIVTKDVDLKANNCPEMKQLLAMLVRGKKVVKTKSTDLTNQYKLKEYIQYNQNLN